LHAPEPERVPAPVIGLDRKRGAGPARAPKHCHDRTILCRRRFRDSRSDGGGQRVAGQTCAPPARFG
jgi:hypothetical protein